MPFNYYGAFKEQLERIALLYGRCGNSDFTVFEEFEEQSARWREMMCDIIGCDDTPPIRRRDLLALVQNLGYVSYETAQLFKKEGITLSAAQELLLPLKMSITAIKEETLLLRSGSCCAERIRRQAMGAISKCQEPSYRELSLEASEGIETVTEAVLRYADALEIAAAVSDT